MHHKFPNSLIRSANHAANAQVRCHNGDGTEDAADRAIISFERKAHAMGYGVFWPGLYPVLKKDDQEIHMPG